MFKEKYSSMNENVSPDKEMVDRVIKSIEETKESTNKSRFFFKPILISASLAMLVLVTKPIIAANFEDIYSLMYQVSPEVAQFFKPVQESCEDNGIRMEVVSAYVHDNVAEVYITMQDLEGNRIDETTDLFDSYSINRPFDSSATTENVGYDKETKTATFLISICEWGNKQIVGDKITFSVRKFISGKKEYNDIPIGVNLTDISTNPPTHRISSNGGSGPKFTTYVQDFETKALVPSSSMDFPVEGFDFTGIGYVDDMLHVQTSVKNNLTKDNHGYFFLKDKEGNKVELDYQFSYAENLRVGDKNRVDYYEYVFDVPQSEIDQYSLYGTFVTSNSFTEGDWQVTFPLEEMESD